MDRRQWLALALAVPLGVRAAGAQPQGRTWRLGYLAVNRLNRRAAAFVDRAFHGACPADLPIEQAKKFELVANLKTANAVGLALPRSLLLRADEVVQ